MADSTQLYAGKIRLRPVGVICGPEGKIATKSPQNPGLPDIHEN
jgi:hypothetical protein